MSLRSVLFVKKTGVQGEYHNTRWKPENLDKTILPREITVPGENHNTRKKKPRETGNTTVPGENQKTGEKTDYQGKLLYQEKTIVPKVNQRTRGISQYQVKTEKKQITKGNYSTGRKPQYQK